MKVFMKKALLYFLSMAILLLPVLSCGKSDQAEAKPSVVEETVLVQEDKEIKQAEIMTQVEQPELSEGMITFYSGDVSILEDGSWYEAEIGDFVTEKNVIKVDSDSYCEVQFGNIAVIKIQENSEIGISAIDLTQGRGNVNLDMNAGTVLSKVQKLTEMDSFRIKTQTAVCGVRGTEFSVSTQEGQDTVLAVKEGSVSVMPKSVDIDRLKNSVAGKGEEVLNIIDRIEKEAPVVTANQEIAINNSVVEKTKASAENVEKIVAEIAEEKGAEVNPETVKRLSKAVEEKNREVVETVEPPKQVTAENAVNLMRIDDMKLIAITPAAIAVIDEGKETEQEVPQAPAVTLHKVSLRTDIEDTMIEFNGKFVAKNSYSGIFPEGEAVHFRITRTGYEPYEMSFTVTDATARRYTIELNKLPEPEVPAKDISIKTDPADAEIFIDNRSAGKGLYTGSYKPGTQVSFTVSKPGFESQSFDIDVTEDTPEIFEVALAAAAKNVTFTAVPSDSRIIIGEETATGRLVKNFKIGESADITISRNGYAGQKLTITAASDSPESYNIRLQKKPVDSVFSPFTAKVIDSIAYHGGRFFAADASGTLYSAKISGDGSWKMATANTPNANSAPLAAGSLVFFSGAKELVIAEAESGKLYSKTALDINSAHMFGRKIITFEDKYIYPRNNSLLISSFRKGEAEDVINLPFESGMTPVVWNRQIVIADQDGTVNFIDPSLKSVTSKITTAAQQPIALSMAVSGDTGMFANRKGKLCAVDLKNKRVVWESEISDSKINIFTTPVYSSGNVFFFTGSSIYAYRISDGSVPYDSAEATSPPAAAGGKLYYGTAGGFLTVADASNGNILQKIQVNSGNITTRPVFADTRIIAGTESGKIAVLNPAGF